MSVNLLLTGRNQQLITEFFQHQEHDFVCYSSSMRKEDMINHLNLVKPVAVICCLSSETDDSALIMSDIRDLLPDYKASLIVVGTKEDCSYFSRHFSFAPDLVLTKPITDEEVLKQVKTAVQMKAKVAASSAAENLIVEDSKKHILVVDDDPLMLRVIKEHLHDKYNVALSNNGLTALKFLETKDTDLIILDYEMPGMNGAEVLANLRQNKKTASTPVVFLTGTKDREKVQSALLLKPQGYLLKPIEKDNLLEMITKLIG